MKTTKNPKTLADLIAHGTHTTPGALARKILDLWEGRTLLDLATEVATYVYEQDDDDDAGADPAADKNLTYRRRMRQRALDRFHLEQERATSLPRGWRPGTPMILLLILLPWLASAGDAPAMPPRVEQALSTYDTDVAKAQDIYRKAVERAKAQAMRTLESEQAAIVRAGDLDGALTVKAKIEALTKHDPVGLGAVDILGRPVEPAPDPSAKLKTMLVTNTWIHFFGRGSKTLKFEEDGSFSLGRNANEFSWELDERQNLLIKNSVGTARFSLHWEPKQNKWIGATHHTISLEQE